MHSLGEDTIAGWKVAVFFTLATVLYIGSSFVPVIFDETEGQYAGAAREMLARNDWLIPTNDGIPRLQKPPVMYWIMMASCKIFGVNVFAARLPNALASLLWIYATYLVGKRVGGRSTGYYAAIIQSTFFGFFIFSHLIMPEPFLGALLTLTFWCFLSALTHPARCRRWFDLAWLCMSLACVVKGLHGLLYPVLVAALCMLFFERQRKVWREMWRLRHLAIFLLIVAPWYAAIEMRFSGFLMDHFVNEQVGHLLDKRFPPDSRAVPSMVFWVQHLVFFLPWTLFAPAVFWARRRIKETGQVFYHHEKVLWLWVVVTAVSIIFSARQDYYTMTSWGGVAIWLALPWAARIQVPRMFWLIPCVLLLVCGVLGLALQGVIDSAVKGATVEVDPVAARDNALNAIRGFSFGGYLQLVPLMKLASVILMVGGGVGTYQAWRRRKASVATVAGIGMLGLMALASWGLALMGQYFSLEGVARGIRNEARPGAMVICQGEPHYATSLFFYLENPINWVDAHPGGEFALREKGIGAELYLTHDKVAECWKSERQVFLIIEQESLEFWREKLFLVPAQTRAVGVSGTRVAIMNRPGNSS
ncbi:MAG: glycosyltransferase family 39 protein [Verrucomicrobiae bacterium]|nr:glycosyltransferase family 39 protein [Verrucomicrobiae bacterium]